jgi:hypothetical protein
MPAAAIVVGLTLRETEETLTARMGLPVARCTREAGGPPARTRPFDTENRVARCAPARIVAF